MSAVNDAKGVEPSGTDRLIEVSEADLQAAWAVLENLAVSIDQIGGYFGERTDAEAEGRDRAMLDALGSYVSQDLVRLIGDARARLARYIPDADAEALVDSIPYWDYAGTRP